MVRYLLQFKTKTDVAVRTLIITLVIALLAAVATEQAYRIFLPEYHALIGGKAYVIAFSLAMLLGIPIIGVFFSAGLEIIHLNTRLELLRIPTTAVGGLLKSNLSSCERRKARL